MRTAAVFMAALLAAGLGAAGQEAERSAPIRRDGNVLTEYLDRANIHPRVDVGRVSFYPVSLSSTDGIGAVLTMDEALAKGVLVIEELASAQVDRARFINKSRTHKIFLMAGEVITGGKQNRTLTTDALLGPSTSVELPLYCVQKGRWTGEKAFSGGTTIAPQSVRAKAAQGAGQSDVWGEVARANERLGSSTPSEDLAAAVNSPANQKRLRELRGQVLPRLPAGCAGVVVASGGSIVAADLFNSAELFAAMREKVLNAHLSQYGLGDVLPVRRGGSVHPEPPDIQEVRRYLQGGYSASFTAGEMRGVGRIYDVRGARNGQTLVYERAVIREDEGGVRPIRPGGRMVHTAFMEEVVPVRPVPVPRPIPLPRPMPYPRPRGE